MGLPRDCVLLRIFVGESKRSGRVPLYQAIVMAAREQGLAGATVLRGPMGYGKSNAVHSAKILDLSADLPMVIELVDTLEKINRFVALAGDMLGGGLVTMEKVQVLHYGRDQEPQ